MDPRTLRQLKSLGYLGGSSTQAAELSGQGTDPKDRLEVLRLLHLAMNSGLPSLSVSSCCAARSRRIQPIPASTTVSETCTQRPDARPMR